MRKAGDVELYDLGELADDPDFAGSKVAVKHLGVHRARAWEARFRHALLRDKARLKTYVEEYGAEMLREALGTDSYTPECLEELAALNLEIASECLGECSGLLEGQSGADAAGELQRMGLLESVVGACFAQQSPKESSLFTAGAGSRGDASDPDLRPEPAPRGA